MELLDQSCLLWCNNFLQFHLLYPLPPSFHAHVHIHCFTLPLSQMASLLLDKESLVHEPELQGFPVLNSLPLPLLPSLSDSPQMTGRGSAGEGALQQPPRRCVVVSPTCWLWPNQSDSSPTLNSTSLFSWNVL